MKKTILLGLLLTSFSYSSTNITITTFNIVKELVSPYKTMYKIYKVVKIQKEKYIKEEKTKKKQV